MSKDTVTIVYSLALGKRRACYVPTVVGEDPGTPNLKAGEAVVYQSITDYKSRGPDAAIQDIIGISIKSDRCVLIDKTNTVVATLHADPVIDVIDSHTLVLHSTAIVGDIQTGTIFLRRYAQINAQGLVTNIIQQNIMLSIPNAVNVGGIVIASTTLQIGNIITLPSIIKSSGALL